MESEKNDTDVNIFDDLFVSDSSDELYSPPFEFSSSESDQISDIELINSNAGPINKIEPIINASSSARIEPITNVVSSIYNKKGKGRNKIAEDDKTRKRKEILRRGLEMCVKKPDFKGILI